jgi:hypothetical protein
MPEDRVVLLHLHQEERGAESTGGQDEAIAGDRELF